MGESMPSIQVKISRKKRKKRGKKGLSSLFNLLKRGKRRHRSRKKLPIVEEERKGKGEGGKKKKTDFMSFLGGRRRKLIQYQKRGTDDSGARSAQEREDKKGREKRKASSTSSWTLGGKTVGEGGPTRLSFSTGRDPRAREKEGGEGIVLLSSHRAAGLSPAKGRGGGPSPYARYSQMRARFMRAISEMGQKEF